MAQDMAEAENIKPRQPRREKKPPKKITEKYLYNSGLAYLQRFPAGTSHFRRVMSLRIDKSCNFHKEQLKDDCLALLDKTIENFTRIGLLNDDAYLQGMVTSLRRRGLSTQAILSKLGQKSMAQDRVFSALHSHDSMRGLQNPDLAAAVMLTRRKCIGAFRKTLEFERQKELAAMGRAGYDFDIAQKALALPLNEAEEMLAQIRS